ncbi:MAG: hypothetical protein ABIH83_00470 [Candidatus Micrarchaeota archaeon]
MNKIYFLPIFLFIFLFSPLFALSDISCTTDEDCTTYAMGDLCNKGICTVYCTKDQKCFDTNLGNKCLDGICVYACYIDGDCFDDEICINYFCIDAGDYEKYMKNVAPPFAKCTRSIDCLDYDSGDSCISGQCREVHCLSDDECIDNLACIQGVCSFHDSYFLLNDYCMDDSHCSSGMVCAGHNCTEEELICTTDEECQQRNLGNACMNGICGHVAEPEGCHPPCAPGFICADTKCILNEVYCLNDSDCKEFDNICISNQCTFYREPPPLCLGIFLLSFAGFAISVILINRE